MTPTDPRPIGVFASLGYDHRNVFGHGWGVAGKLAALLDILTHHLRIQRQQPLIGRRQIGYPKTEVNKFVAFLKRLTFRPLIWSGP